MITLGLTHLISFYQKFISPAFAPRCKYYPSCSQYTADALKAFGAKGALLGLWRLIRCNPFSHGGVDYIPSEFLGKRTTTLKSSNTAINQPNLEATV